MSPSPSIPTPLLGALLALSTSVIGTSRAAEPSAADLRHGQKQLQRMLEDRPEIAVYRAKGSPVTRYITESDAPWQWAQRAYAGSQVGERVFWDHRPPLHESSSDSTSPYFHGLYSVRLHALSQVKTKDLEYAWARFVYEMLTMSRATERDQLAHLVYSRQVTPAAAVREYARLQWSVDKQVEQFYHQTWQPWARTRGIPSHPHFWSHDHLSTFESWYEEQRASYDYVRTYYEELLQPPGK